MNCPDLLLLGDFVCSQISESFAVKSEAAIWLYVSIYNWCLSQLSVGIIVMNTVPDNGGSGEGSC